MVLASSAFLFSRKPIRLQVYDFHVILHLVAKQHCTRSAVLVSNPNTALRFCNHCIATCNQRVIDCITLRLSHAPVQPRNHSNVTRPFPTRGLGAGNEITVDHNNIVLTQTCLYTLTFVQGPGHTLFLLCTLGIRPTYNYIAVIDNVMILLTSTTHKFD